MYLMRSRSTREVIDKLTREQIVDYFEKLNKDTRCSFSIMKIEELRKIMSIRVSHIKDTTPQERELRANLGIFE